MTEKLVCNNCFDEEGIKAFITLNGEVGTCFFCGEQSTCVSIECVSGHIVECLRPYYTDEPEGVYDGEEGRFWEELDPFDILHDTVFFGSDMIPNYDNPICVELRKAFSDGIWTRRDPYREDYWWEIFSEFVKFKRRYFFLEQDLTEDEPALRGNPKEMLSITLEYCRNFLVKRDKLKLFRCRHQKQKEQLNKLEDFLSPSPEKATIANRMNPPGIPHLYAATDLDTAFEETKREKGIYKIAEIELNQEINLIDLSNLPPIPSRFDPDPLKRCKLTTHKFIHRFENAINSPIAGDDKIYIDYVPSQIFCEYIKEKSPEIHGIIYNSKKCLSGKNICLFIKRDEIKTIINLISIKTKNSD